MLVGAFLKLQHVSQHTSIKVYVSHIVTLTILILDFVIDWSVATFLTRRG